MKKFKTFRELIEEAKSSNKIIRLKAQKELNKRIDNAFKLKM